VGVLRSVAGLVVEYPLRFAVTLYRRELQRTLLCSLTQDTVLAGRDELRVACPACKASRGHVIASDIAICPSKSSLFAIARY
jgi:hypothetical protein